MWFEIYKVNQPEIIVLDTYAWHLKNTYYTLNKATFILKQNIYTFSNYLSKTGTTKYHSHNTSDSPKILLLPDSWSLEKTKAHRFTGFKRF